MRPASVASASPFASAFKPQIAYFAAHRAEDQLERLIAHIHLQHPGLPVILDAKRGDIGSTAEQYAREAFERYRADAVTVNPYMGFDSIEPYLEYEDKGVVVLCRTSNPGGSDLQFLETGGRPLYQVVADLAATELVPGMRLAALDPARRLTEMEFLFPAPALDFNALRRLLAAHGYPDVALEAGTLAGFVKGFIDMIVEHDGRFWIVDWKSNHLGTTPEAYGERALDAAMAHHAYHLQALLYMVALHRYLRVRMHGYDYDAHIAGYLYVFVRGVRPDWRNGGASAGVHARRPARALIEALDALMREGDA